MWPFSRLYERIPELESEFEPETISNFRKRTRVSLQKSNITAYILALLVSVNTLALGVWSPFFGPQARSESSSYHQHHATSAHLPVSTFAPTQHQDCGSTVASARAANCAFDLLSNSWLPSSCYDYETDLEFRSWIVHPNRTHGAWPYFTSRSLSHSTHIPDIETLSSTIGVWLWSTQEQHVGHCIFWARRVHRTLEGKVKQSMSVKNMKHSFHCANEVLDSLLGEAPLKKLDAGVVHFMIQIDTCA
jgi:hypothetical protein